MVDVDGGAAGVDGAAGLAELPPPHAAADRATANRAGANDADRGLLKAMLLLTRYKTGRPGDSAKAVPTTMTRQGFFGALPRLRVSEIVNRVA